MKTVKITIIFILFFQSGFAQNYDPKKLTKNLQIDLIKTDFRGIEAEKEVVYFVENDLQTLSSFEKDKLKWKINVMSFYKKTKVGNLKIRFVKLNGKFLEIIYGKDEYVKVSIKNGQTAYSSNN